MPGLEFAQEEAADGAFVIRESGAVIRQQRMRRDFDAEGDGALDGTVEREVIDVTLGDVSSAEDEAVGLNVERGQRGLHLSRDERLPFGGALAFLVKPGSETFLEGRGASREFYGQSFFGGADASGVLGLALGEVGRGDVVGRFVGVVQQRHQRIIIRVQDRVVLMRVALGAVERQAHPSGPRDGDAIDHGVEAVLVGIRAAFFVEHRVAMEAGGDEIVGRGIGQEVARELPDAELVVRHVRVQGLHDPVAVGPDRAGAILLEAVGVGVAGEVQPAARPAFAVAGRSHQAVDELLVGVGGLVVHEGVGFLGRRRHSGEVERDATDECVAVRFGRRFQAGLGEAGADERVDRVDAGLGQGSLLRRGKGPVRLILAAFGDPGAQHRLLFVGHRLLGFRWRHQLVGFMREDTADDFALFRLTGDDGEFAGLSLAVGGIREVEA